MANWQGRKRGLDGFKSTPTSQAGKHAKKNFHFVEKPADCLSSGSSGNTSNERSTGDVSEEERQSEIVYKEPSMYNVLLKALGSGKESLSNVYNRIQSEEEGRSEDEDEDGDGDEGDERNEEDDYDEDNEDNAEESDSEKETKGNHDMYEVEDEKTESEDDSMTSDMDQEHELVNVQPSTDSSVSTCSFYVHVGHNLTEKEIDNLTKKKLKYSWEEPAYGMPNCKWMGTGECFLKDSNISHYGLNPKLYKHLSDVYGKSGSNDFQLAQHNSFFFLCSSYRDILHCNKKPFYLKGMQEDSNVMDAYIIHSLNHIFKTRDLVMRNDSKLGKQKGIADEILMTAGLFDHGFTRPKVLILLPLGSIAFRFVKRLIQLTPSKNKAIVEHMDRFCKKFGGQDEDDMEQDPEDIKFRKSSKPSDYRLLFHGEDNDSFIIGIKFTKGSIKLYSDFYSSDIILASPAGLVNKFIEAQRLKEKDVDYLSSIEVLIIDHADVITMQNWSHVDTILQRLNRIPVNQHGTNVMRIRPWYLDGQSKFYRQTIMLGFYLNPDINALFNGHCFNFEGKPYYGTLIYRLVCLF